MTTCCSHTEDEHHRVTICTEQIHYPSEDYPCLCEGMAGDGAVCPTCGHKRESHLTKRICRFAPDSCDCAS